MQSIVTILYFKKVRVASIRLHKGTYIYAYSMTMGTVHKHSIERS